MPKIAAVYAPIVAVVGIFMFVIPRRTFQSHSHYAVAFIFIGGRSAVACLEVVAIRVPSLLVGYVHQRVLFYKHTLGQSLLVGYLQLYIAYGIVGGYGAVDGYAAGYTAVGCTCNLSEVGRAECFLLAKLVDKVCRYRLDRNGRR